MYLEPRGWVPVWWGLEPERSWVAAGDTAQDREGQGELLWPLPTFTLSLPQGLPLAQPSWKPAGQGAGEMQPVGAGPLEYRQEWRESKEVGDKLWGQKAQHSPCGKRAS